MVPVSAAGPEFCAGTVTGENEARKTDKRSAFEPLRCVHGRRTIRGMDHSDPKEQMPRLERMIAYPTRVSPFRQARYDLWNHDRAHLATPTGSLSPPERGEGWG